jgi:DNA-binding response OmpR family regulator
VTEPIHTYAIRFESRDDFLVEYTDRLRHGYVLLPLDVRFTNGTPVRLRVHLPDEGVLFLTGAAIDTPRSVVASEQDGQWIKLAPLNDQAKLRLGKCVDELVGRDAESGEHEVPRRAAPVAGALSVLLVDDSVSQRIELGDALRARGLRVRVAENGLVALSSVLKRPPDAILTDVEMPQMDGWTLLRTVRQRAGLAHVPIVFLTRLSDDLTRLRGYRMGVDDYLPKAMPADEIVARLHGAIARRRQLHAHAGAVQGLRGDLEHVRLGSVLAFLESERRSGALHLHRPGDEATMQLREGAFCQLDNLGRYGHPHDRIFELLGWTSGEFEFVADDSTMTGDRTPLSYLLLEHARRADEAVDDDRRQMEARARSAT